MMIGIYRVLYGADFVVESIRSILPHVDKVIVYQAPRPWGVSTGAHYRGEWVSWPAKFDDLSDRVLGMNEPSVEIVDNYYPTPFGQYEHIINNLLLPNYPKLSDVVTMEPDWVWAPAEAEWAFSEWASRSHLNQAHSRQIEMWRTCDWRTPERLGRATPSFQRVGVRAPAPNLLTPSHELGGSVYNLGFCASEATLRWKHLTGIAFTAEIKDCAPNPDWFEEKWKKWNPVTNNTNLEISLGLEYKIPCAIPYEALLVPESIRLAVAKARAGDSK